MSEKYSNYYKRHYWNVHYKGLLSFFTNGIHRKLEKDNVTGQFYSNVLEIGGGAGEHLKFVRHGFETYLLLDISENTEGLLRVKSDPRASQIRFVLADAAKIPLKNDDFDRVLVTCVLHHIPNLEMALAEIRRVAKSGAKIDIYLPCDPGMLYRWIRHWVSHFKQKRIMELTWVEVKHLWALEHRNHYLAILSLIRGIFIYDDVRIKRYPFRLFSWNLNLYSLICIQIKK
jgi:phosphatidylethanolamine/phosphatidyl-N-methylethanolamine N-methyltransferase